MIWVYSAVALGFFWALVKGFERSDGWLYFSAAVGLIFMLVVIVMELI